ncbi:Uncharacterised protein [Shigella flexneri]|nr:Uncharacterised protein [Shigella flexneri]
MLIVLAFAGDSTMTRALPIFTLPNLILPGMRRTLINLPLATSYRYGLALCGYHPLVVTLFTKIQVTELTGLGLQAL